MSSPVLIEWLNAHMRESLRLFVGTDNAYMYVVCVCVCNMWPLHIWSTLMECVRVCDVCVCVMCVHNVHAEGDVVYILYCIRSSLQITMRIHKIMGHTVHHECTVSISITAQKPQISKCNAQNAYACNRLRILSPVVCDQ